MAGDGQRHEGDVMPAAATLPPGPIAPGGWQSLRYQFDPIAYLEACAARYGPVFTLSMPIAGRFVAAVDARDVHAILASVPDRFPGRAQESPLAPLVGESAMMFASGATHRRQRRVLRPAFHGRVVERWREQLGAIAQAELARLPLDAPLPLLPTMRRIALEAVCRLVFGSVELDRYRRLREEVGRRYDARLLLMLLWPTLWSRSGRLNPGLALKRRRDAVNRLLLDAIALRRAEAPSDAVDALSLLVAARDEDGAALTDAEVRDQLIGLVLVGHDTTASALAWALERLSRTPHAARRLAAELAEGRDEYLDAVIRETLRLRPPLMDVPRTTTAELELGGWRIPPGTVVSAMLPLAHRDVSHWEDPLAFRPERFLDGTVLPHAFVPFGGGARRCLAVSFATLLMHVVVRTALEGAMPARAPGPEETLRLAGASLVPSRGGRVVLRAQSARSSSISGGRVASTLG
jgi:cytochrome P450 family 135